MPIDTAEDSPPAPAVTPPLRRQASPTDTACRALDLVLAAVLLVLLTPLLGVIALLIAIDSPGPVIFRQPRVGRRLQRFTVHKFRTMHHGAPPDVHREYVTQLIAGGAPKRDGDRLRFKLVEDDRLTRLGRLLRRTSLDELPQLWNVLRGDMSLVGPRPPIPYEVERYPAHWFARFAVRPGITGLWQVNGRSTVPLEEMIRLDIEYVQRRSLWLNACIILRTVPAVLRTRGAL